MRISDWSSDVCSSDLPDKGLEIISRVVVERLLPYFVDKERPCPRVVIREVNNASSTVALNDYLGKENSQIVEMKVDEPTFTLTASEETKTFQVRVFKFYAQRAARSKVSLVENRREVQDNPLQYNIQEFSEQF